MEKSCSSPGPGQVQKPRSKEILEYSLEFNLVRSGPVRSGLVPNWPVRAAISFQF